MKPIVIPDLHGQLDLLEAALAAYPGRRVVFTGDYVDRGPDTPGVVRVVRRLVDAGEAVALWGNHDWMMARALLDTGERARAYREVWEANGGLEAQRQYASPEAMLDDARWFEAHLRHWYTEGGVLYAHAARPQPGRGGQLPARPQDEEHLWSRPEEGLYPLPIGCAVSVHGHTPVEQPVSLEMDDGPAWFIDLGGFFTGKLAVLDTEDWQVRIFTQ